MKIENKTKIWYKVYNESDTAKEWHSKECRTKVDSDGNKCCKTGESAMKKGKTTVISAGKEGSEAVDGTDN